MSRTTNLLLDFREAETLNHNKYIWKDSNTNLQKKTFIVELVNMIIPILDLSHKRDRTLRIGEVSASWFETERISGSETFVRPINL